MKQHLWFFIMFSCCLLNINFNRSNSLQSKVMRKQNQKYPINHTMVTKYQVRNVLINFSMHKCWNWLFSVQYQLSATWPVLFCRGELDHNAIKYIIEKNVLKNVEEKSHFCTALKGLGCAHPSTADGYLLVVLVARLVGSFIFLPWK